MERKRLRVGKKGDVRGVGRLAGEEGGDVRGPGLQGVGGLAEVVLEEEVADLDVKGVVDAALALEGIALG